MSHGFAPYACMFPEGGDPGNTLRYVWSLGGIFPATITISRRRLSFWTSLDGALRSATPHDFPRCVALQACHASLYKSS